MDLSPVLISLKTACSAMFFTFWVGLVAAKFIVQLRNRTVKIVADCIFTLPLVLPPTVVGFFLLVVFGVGGPIGKFFIDFFAVKIAFSWGATVLAAFVVAFPLMYRSSRSAIEQIDVNLIYAARTLGLSELKIFFKVIMPCALPGIAGGAVLSFARGLGEFGATVMIAGNINGVTQTIPLAVYSEVAAGNWDSALNYVVIIVLISFFFVGGINYFAGSELNSKKIKKKKVKPA